MNGDGWDDVVVGESGRSSGRAYVYLGSASGLGTTPAATLVGPDIVGDDFGWSAAIVGDVNGDGLADIVVGAYGVGRAYVFFGDSVRIDSVAAESLSMEGTDAGTFYGLSVSGAGDIDGDGYDDVLVGAGTAAGGSGRAYLYAGGSGGLSATPATVLTSPGSDGFGMSVSGAGDVDGDGYADIVVGAVRGSSAAHSNGDAYVYLGGAAGVSVTPVVLGSTIAGSTSLGSFVAGVGDVDGDGYDDVLVGRITDAGGPGTADVHLGGPTGPSRAASVSLSAHPTLDFGTTVCAAGDLDGDGYADVAVGDYGVGTTGAAYVFFGGREGVDRSSTLLLPSAAGVGSSFGLACGNVGDVDGDGRDDLGVGASNVGMAFVYTRLMRGGPTTPGIVLRGVRGDAEMFGQSID